MSKFVPRSLSLLALAAVLALLALLATAQQKSTRPQQAGDFSKIFTGQTLRFDYFHSGTQGEEQIALDAIRLEDEWPGSRRRLIDDTNLGKYLFSVRDAKSGQQLYSRGFASIYGEWETTGEAADGTWRTFHESQRFPEPKRPVILGLEKRDAAGDFVQIFSLEVDPAHRSVVRAALSQRGTLRGNLRELEIHGAARDHVDLLLLGDGYTASEESQFFADAERAMGYLFSHQPFARHREAFNVRALYRPAAHSGVTDPRAGRWRDSPLGLSYNAFDSERYLLTYENRALRDLAAQAPYDALILLANSDKYGGGGIFNLWTTAAIHSSQAAYLVVHEFGHSFAGLADEYYTSPVSYEDFTAPGVEPWEPNITALLDPAKLKWRALMSPEAQTPLPTPWNQELYDKTVLAFQAERAKLRAAGASESTMDAYFAKVKNTTEPMLQAEPHAGQVGAFEGAGYQAKGLYRPAIDCLMFTRNPDDFCPVCSAAIERVIRLYTE